MEGNVEKGSGDLWTIGGLAAAINNLLRRVIYTAMGSSSESTRVVVM